MTKKLLVPVTLLLLFALNGKLFSKEKIKGTTGGGWCATESPDASWEAGFQKRIEAFKAQQQAQRSQQAGINIPVIVHVIYYSNTTAQNITKAQIDSQINILNRDYAGQSSYIANVPAPFKPLIANTGITWCAAKIDRNGNVLTEPGIDRINARATAYNFTNPGVAGWTKDYIDGTIKPATIWNPKVYCNIWIVPGIAGGTAGSVLVAYATFPTMTGLSGLFSNFGTEETDGIVCSAWSYGKGGSTTSPTNQGGTATHELGHWLGLRHISGDEPCGNDYVADTPQQLGGNAGGQNGQNYGCPTYPYHPNGCDSTGPNGEMFMDFMDYTNDNCNNMFSNGQKERMLTTMANGDLRVPLLSSPVCDVTLPAPVADFSNALISGSLCTATQTYNFTDKSLFTPTTWSWTFSGGSPSTSGIKNPTGIAFSTPGPHDITLTVTNSKGSSTITKTITVNLIGTGTLPFVEGFEGATFPPEGWNIVNRNGNADIHWDSSRSVGGFGTSSSCMRFDNTTLDAQHAKDDIVSPKINLTGISNAKLKFDVAYSPYHDSTQDIYDTLVVLLTTDCEATSTQIYSKGGNTLRTAPGQGDEFYPTASQWRTDSIVLPTAYQNKANVQVIFRNLGNFGHTIYVDNVNLNSPTAVATATASFTASDTTVCAGGTLTFTNTSTASTGSPDSVRWTIPGGVPSTSTSTTTVTPVFSTPGTYVISLVAYKTGLPSAAATKSIRVKAKPTVGVNSPTICSGNTATLTATGATTYSWTGGLAATSPVTTPALTSTTTYTVTGTTSGCTGTATATITVTPNPTVGVNSPTICSGTTATLTASGATTYTWTGGLAATSPVTTPTLTNTTTYTVTGTTSGCTGTAVATVTVTPLPPVAVNSPGICSGNTATLTATGASSYTWTGGLAATSPVTTPTLTTTTTYTVTGTTGSCSKTAVATVTVTAVPTVGVNSPTICSGQTATLTATGATSYTWTGGLAATSPVTTPTLTNTTTYTVTGTTNGCTGTAVATVTVNPSPPVGVNSPTICSGQTATLTATGATTYSWTGGLAATSPVTTPALTSTTTYTVTGTASGCTATAVATVTVTPLPNITVNSPSICSGSTATLTANGASNGYVWSTLATTQSITVSPTSTTTYTVTGTTGSCSKTVTSTVTVTSSTPTVTIASNPTPPSICLGDPITLTASGADSYIWDQSGAVGNVLTFTPTGNITVHVSGTLAGCSSAGVAQIVIATKPKPTVGVNSPTICSGQTASLSAVGADTYAWTGGLSSAANVTTPVLTSTNTYTVTGTTDGCTGTATSTVTVKPLPNTALTASSNGICSGDSVVLNASGADTYSWSPSGSGTSQTVTPVSTVTYVVTGTTDGCTKSASQTITVTSPPATPSITQSGDTLYSSVIVVGANYKWYKDGILQTTTPTPWYKITGAGNYTLIVDNNNCASAESGSFAAVFTGVKNNRLNVSFAIVPNPSNGNFEVRMYSTVNKKYSLSLYNLAGQVILKDEMNMRAGANVKTINLKGIEKGVYLITITGDSGTITQSIIVQ